MNRKTLCLLIAAGAFAPAAFAFTTTNAAKPRPDIVLADFEGADYGDWKTTGTAFGSGPAPGGLPDQMPISGFQGKGMVNSYHGGDGVTGTLTGPPFKIERRYLNFLIGGGQHPHGLPGETSINVLVDGIVVRSATGPNGAPGGTERLDWASWDLSDLQGKTAHIEIVDQATGGWGHINIDQITESDERFVEDIRTAPLYDETYRPQFHFTAKHGWLNDPNGMVFDGTEYHLFFQHFPGSNQPNGDMYWGQAVSTDMVHWREIGEAIVPDKYGAIFSGSAVIDHDNTSGFGQPGGEKPLVAIYTAAGGYSPESKGQPFTQRIVYSLDRGRTFTNYAGNPVIPHIVAEDRDPKLVWYAPTRHWVLALYLDHDDYGLFASPDLKTWKQTQTVTVPGSSECPDFFPIPLDGDSKQIKWVMTGANGHYVVGDFDGTTFTPTGPPQPADRGASYYAVQTFSDIPASDGRRIQIAWMRGGNYPQMPFTQQMSFPCELTLHTTPDGPRLYRYPVREIETLHGKPHRYHDLTLTPTTENPLRDLSGDLWDIEATFAPGDATAVGLRIRGEDVRYDTAAGTLTSLNQKAPLRPTNGLITLRLLVDRTSLEVFGNGGQASLTNCFLPAARDKSLAVYAEGGTAKLVSLTVYPVQSAWEKTGK